MSTYRFSDVETQERMLSEQLKFVSGQDFYKACKAMRKRVARFYGLNNKYHSNGKLRSQ